jgi:tetratricopeptide (TPR) repeat protein
MLRDLGLPANQTLGIDSLERVRRYVHTDTVIAGSSVALGEKGTRTIRVDLRAQDVDSGETLAPVVAEGAEADLVSLVVAAGSRLREQLGALALSQAERREALSALPGPDAAALYAEGVERLRQSDALAARDALQRAVQTQEDYPLAHSALASAWSALGYDAKALVSARRAFELSAKLPLTERLWIEGSFHEIAGDSRRAAEVFATLWSLHSDQLDYAIRLAAAQARSGQQMAALTVIESLRQLPAPDRDDPRIDLAEAEASSAASDFRRAASAAARAVEKGRARGQRWLVARALLAQAWAQRNLGEADAGQAAAAEARRLFEESSQPDGAARSLTLLSTFHRDRGDLQGARRLDEEALLVFRRIGNERQAALALNNYGKGLALAGDLATARARLEEALEICRRIEDREGVARQTNNLAEVTLALGNALAAEPLYREAAAGCRASGDRRICADVARGLGDALAALGKLDQAETSYRESLALARELAHRRYEAYALHGLGEVLALEGQLDAAREHHEMARSIRLELGERTNAASSALALARLALATGQPRLTESLSSEAERQLGPEQRDQRALAMSLRVRALAKEGSGAAALHLVQPLQDLANGAQNPRTASAAASAEADLSLTLTDVDRARAAVTRLEDLAAASRRDGRLPDALELDLVAASARQLFDPRVALAAAQRVETAAREVGLLRIAGDAARVVERIRKGE